MTISFSNDLLLLNAASRLPFCKYLKTTHNKSIFSYTVFVHAKSVKALLSHLIYVCGARRIVIPPPCIQVYRLINPGASAWCYKSIRFYKAVLLTGLLLLFLIIVIIFIIINNLLCIIISIVIFITNSNLSYSGSRSKSSSDALHSIVFTFDRILCECTYIKISRGNLHQDKYQTSSFIYINLPI